MATKSKGRADDWQARENAYVRHSMNKEHVEAFTTWLDEQDEPDLVALLSTVLEAGLEVKVLKRNGGFTSVLHSTQREADGVSFLLTGWAKSGISSLWVVLWKDSVLAQGDWSTLESNAPEAPEFR